jgi:type IV pilus assembly protein PilC
LVCYLALKLVPRISATRKWMDRLALRLPLIGSVVHSAGLAQFYRTMGVAMQSGANMAIAMQFTAMTASNEGMRRRIVATYAKIQKSSPYIDALVQDGLLRLGDVKAVQAGERRGDIGSVMLTLATDREREALAEAKSLKALSHTLVVILLGLTILGVVFTLYVPVFVTR